MLSYDFNIIIIDSKLFYLAALWLRLVRYVYGDSHHLLFCSLKMLQVLKNLQTHLLEEEKRLHVQDHHSKKA